MSSARYFFASTASVNQELGNIQSFVTSALVAQWNLREAVEEYVRETGTVDHHAMQQKIVRESGVASLDLSYTCLKQSWPQQKEQFAKFYLFEICTFYEAWLDEVVPRAAIPSDKRRQDMVSWLQFPTGNGPKENPGLAKAITEVNQDPSPLLKKEFFPQLSAHRKNSWSVMDNCLKAYRAFKEIRNSFIHQGGKATDRAAECYSAMMLVPAADLGFRRPFSFPP